MPAKRVVIDGVVMQAMDLLQVDLHRDFRDLSDEAFRDLLKKYHRPVGLKSALQQSVKAGRRKAKGIADP
jgi:hypothetical protein